jgi:hypothetical protein
MRASTQAVLACPNCGSQDVKTLKIVHAQGTSSGSAVTSGWSQGYGNQQGHSTTSASRINLSTKAARDAAPPRMKRDGAVLIVIGIVGGGVLAVLGYSFGTSNTFGNPTINVAVGIVIGLITIVAGVALAMRDSNYNRSEYPNALGKWDRSWQCQRCGTVSVL